MHYIHTSCIHKYLLRDRAYRRERQWLELGLLQEVVQVLLKHLEDKTRVVLVLEALVRAHKVELVGVLMAEPGEDRDLDGALASVRRVVLEYLDGDDLVRALLPALDDLAEGAAPQELEHLVGGRDRVQHFMLDQLVVALATPRRRARRPRLLRRAGLRRDGFRRRAGFR